MSILIKGMEMPKNCKSCPLRYSSTGYAWCDITGESLALEIDMRDDTCPLVELPQHGRLIDVDEPMTKISTMMQEPDYQHEGENWMVGLIMARDAIDDAPTVIEAEGET